MSELNENGWPAARGSGPIWEQLQSMLIPGEEVWAYALEHRFYARLHRRHVVAATSGRFVYMQRPLFGGYRPVDVRWQDVKDARISVGMFSATVTLIYSTNLSDTAAGEGAPRVLVAKNISKSDAQALYRVCQEQEQSWREKRRVRSMEEMRAQAGGIQIATGLYPQEPASRQLEFAGSSAGGAETPVQRLGRAKEMLEQRLITDSEFEAIKARVVDAL
jgi:hypothetical protein